MSKNHMAEVAALLGVELGEPFKITDDTYGIRQSYYRLTEENGCEISDDNTSWVTVSAEVLKWLIMGDVRISKLPWKPEYNEKYYIPSISNAVGYNKFYWRGDDSDDKYYNLGLVFKSKDEAIKLAEEMLDVARKRFAGGTKQEENNG